MNYSITLTEEADSHLLELKNDQGKQVVYKAVLKSIKLMHTNLRHPSLQTHEYSCLSGPNDEKVFEAYAQQNTPNAYRIFWYFGPKRGQITIFAIVPHP